MDRKNPPSFVEQNYIKIIFKFGKAYFIISIRSPYSTDTIMLKNGLSVLNFKNII